MKILHTSDWHLGRTLYGRKRYDEFSKFLQWLADTIEQKEIDLLLVSGDVFDTCTPSNKAQQLYYRFLCRISDSCCKNVVVIAGNHDSPSFLDAPKELLRALNVTVVGAASENFEDEVFAVNGKDENAEAIVCAVPYLRDKEIRTAEPGENIDDKNRKIAEGIKEYYEKIAVCAETKRNDLLYSEQYKNTYIPIIATGHLFASGGKTIDGDGVRELYVGSLAFVHENVFPASIDYLALGHLHVPQIVSGKENIRYSGSPIPMGFGEADQEKSVVIIEFDKTGKMQINIDKIPCFQQLIRITGSLDDIIARLEELKKQESRAWIEIEYIGSDIIADLSDRMYKNVADSNMEILRIKNRCIADKVIKIVENETLDDLNENDVFVRCMDSFDIPDDQRAELIASYNEVIRDIDEEDARAD